MKHIFTLTSCFLSYFASYSLPRFLSLCLLTVCVLAPCTLMAEGANIATTRAINIDTAKATEEIDSLLESLTEDNDRQKSIDSSNSNADIVQSIGIGDLISMPYAEIIVINKITAKSERVKLKIGQIQFFGNLSVQIHKCIKNPSLYNPNNMILLSIFDNKIDDDKLSLFNGWMMSNNISISTLEHPVYEIIAVNCLAPAPVPGQSHDPDQRQVKGQDQNPDQAQ